LYNTEKINSITAAETKIISNVVSVLLIMCSIFIISHTANIDITVKNNANTASKMAIPLLNINLRFKGLFKCNELNNVMLHLGC